MSIDKEVTNSPLHAALVEDELGLVDRGSANYVIAVLAFLVALLELPLTLAVWATASEPMFSSGYPAVQLHLGSSVIALDALLAVLAACAYVTVATRHQLVLALVLPLTTITLGVALFEGSRTDHHLTTLARALYHTTSGVPLHQAAAATCCQLLLAVLEITLLVHTIQVIWAHFHPQPRVRYAWQRP